MIQTHRFISNTVSGTHSYLREYARIVGAIHFEQCVIHFDDFVGIYIDHTATEHEDGTYSYYTEFIVYYDDEPYSDDEDGDESDVPVSNSPENNLPPEVAEFFAFAEKFFQLT
jgi:hypothetical protein